MREEIKNQLIEWAELYNDPAYFEEDPIAFPRQMARRGSSLQDIEITALLCAHLAWGRRAMIVRDCNRLLDEMQWRPYEYILAGSYRDDDTSLHRTIKWSEIASICGRLRDYYAEAQSLESLPLEDIRTRIIGSKADKNAANKKLHMMRRWVVRRDGKVDLGLWRNSSPSELTIPLDVHVYEQAKALGLSSRTSKDIRTAIEITDSFRLIWPDDPAKGDFALFGYGVSNPKH